MFSRPLSRRAFVRLAGAGVLATSVLSSGIAFAADPQAASADQAVQLVDRPLSGHLDAGSGGHFAFYKFAYPADGSTATVNLMMTPDDPMVLQNAGLVILNPDGSTLVKGGQQPHLNPNVSGNVILNDPNRRGVYTVQVYNYNPTTPVDFTIWVTGIPMPPASALTTTAPAAPVAPAPAIAAPGVPAPAPAPAIAPAPAPAAGTNDAPERAIQLQPNGTETGTIEGGTGGHFLYYKFDYPGDRSTVAINLEVTPDDATILSLAGFNIYGPTPGKNYGSGGAQKGLNPNVSGDLISNEGGTYTIQVYNYNPQTPISFTLTTSNLPPQPAAAPAPAPAAPAPAPAPSAPAASVPAAPAPAAPAPAAASPTPTTGEQSLQGQNSFSGHLDPGKTALYEFTYPGDQSVYTVGMELTPNDPQIARNAGFTVTGPKPGKVYAQGGYQGGLVPNESCNVISSDPGTYTVQVFNYSSVPIGYTLSLTAGKKASEFVPS
ncbi:MAG TPA: hypothetical protein VFC93_10905 [Chloroflexota bacterium]|nr:hypothetical protein [Chloroflexota bacterium]